MDAVTYSNTDVQRFLEESVVPCKIEFGKEAERARDLGIFFTPGLVWLSPEGRLAHQNVGFLPPDEFLAESHLGLGKAAGSQKDWKDARRHFDQVIEGHPRSFARPAALFWGGAAAKLGTNKTEELMEYWKRLLHEHRDSSWAMKIAFIEQK